jgi:ATPase subunit of ABC transporter with duplicated ATPase domains
MLVAMEDLLDTWPGTLLVISHDRYLLERITDQQFAVLDSHVRHLPGGVDQYLALAAAGRVASAGRGAVAGRVASAGRGAVAGRVAPQARIETSTLSGADRRNAEKELASIERKLTKMQDEEKAQHEKLAVADQSDYQLLTQLTAELRELEATVADLETRWLELSELLA